MRTSSSPSHSRPSGQNGNTPTPRVSWSGARPMGRPRHGRVQWSPSRTVGMGVLFFWSPQRSMALGPALVPHSAHLVIGVGPRNNLRGDGRRRNRTVSNPRHRAPPNEITNARERWRKKKNTKAT